MFGKMMLAAKDKSWFLVVTPESERIFCPKRALPVDEVGRRFLAIGEKIFFDAVPGDTGPLRQATNVKLAKPRLPIDPALYRETGIVTKFSPGDGHCFLTRIDPFKQSSGMLYMHIKQLRGNHPATGFQIDQQWEYMVAPPRNKPDQPWCAVDAVLISQSESVAA